MKNAFLLCLLLMGSLCAQTTSKNLLIVAQDGSGDFTTVQEAFNAIPLNNTKDVLIRIKKGVYKEKLTLDSTKHHVTIMGEDPETTVLTYDDFSEKSIYKVLN